MDFFDDPSEMSPEQRFQELAAILASAHLRVPPFRPRTASGPMWGPFTEKELDSSGAPLPLCDEGLTDRDPAPMEVA